MSAPQRHPVADLLTDEMRERVRAATFTRRRSPLKRAQVTGKVGRFLCCPLGVALGRYDSDLYRFPSVWIAVNLLGVHADYSAWEALIDFTTKVDTGAIKPEAIRAVLGCEL